MDFDPRKGFGTLSAGNPSWTDQLAGKFSDLMGMMGSTPQGQRNAYGVAQTGAGFIPGVGGILSANDAYRNFRQGNITQGILSSVGAIPFPGGLTGGAERATMGAEARSMIKAYHGSNNSIDKMAAEIPDGYGAMDQGHGVYLAEHPDVAREYMKSGSGETASNPTLHEVSVNHNIDDFMKWDHGMDEQSPIVRKALKKLGLGDAESGYDAYQTYVNDAIESGRHDHEFDASKEFSDKLSSMGVPGIRYIDDTTSVPGEHHNLVVFDPSSIAITNRMR